MMVTEPGEPGSNGCIDYSLGESEPANQRRRSGAEDEGELTS